MNKNKYINFINVDIREFILVYQFIISFDFKKYWV